MLPAAAASSMTPTLLGCDEQSRIDPGRAALSFESSQAPGDVRQLRAGVGGGQQPVGHELAQVLAALSELADFGVVVGALPRQEQLRCVWLRQPAHQHLGDELVGGGALDADVALAGAGRDVGRRVGSGAADADPAVLFAGDETAQQRERLARVAGLAQRSPTDCGSGLTPHLGLHDAVERRPPEARRGRGGRRQRGRQISAAEPTNAGDRTVRRTEAESDALAAVATTLENQRRVMALSARTLRARLERLSPNTQPAPPGPTGGAGVRIPSTRLPRCGTRSQERGVPCTSKGTVL